MRASERQRESACARVRKNDRENAREEQDKREKRIEKRS